MREALPHGMAEALAHVPSSLRRWHLLWPKDWCTHFVLNPRCAFLQALPRGLLHNTMPWIKYPRPYFVRYNGLRRSFPADLIYAPDDVGGCGESRLSDIAQLQKWQYLDSVTHLGQGHADAVTALIVRAQHALA
jgi:hypothetical protein